MVQLKNKKVKELVEKKYLIAPQIPMPRAHWYEMKTPDFHLEARKNAQLLRMFTLY